MATSVSGVTENFFPTAENGFTTTTSGSVSSGATSVGLNSVAGYDNGDVVVFVIDPTDASKKQTFTGVIDTSGSQVTNVKWTAGTNQSHALGATVVDYETATHWALYSKGISQFATQAGALKEAAVRAALNLGTASTSGWEVEAELPDTITYNGNRSYDLVFNSTDLTDTISEGMRLRLTRTVSAPTQCTDLESGSSQYWNDTSVSGMTFTDDFVVSAWVKLESYTNTNTIASRYNGTSGWILRTLTDGRIEMLGFNGSASNYSDVLSYQSIPLGKWVHVAAQLDMSAFTATSTTSYIMIDGVDVPCSVNRAGTNPTALVQAGNLEIGASNGGTAGTFFDGKLAQVAIFNAKVTQATMRGYMSQGLSGSETSLISAYSFNNTINDLNTTNANNLTAQNSALATNVDSPFGNYLGATLEYGIIAAKPTFSTNTTVVVQVPEGCAIPTSGGISAVSYSTNKVPYGFPADSGQWGVDWLLQTSVATSGTTVSTIYNPGGSLIRVPKGKWYIGGDISTQTTNTSTVYSSSIALSTSASSVTDARLAVRDYMAVLNTASFRIWKAVIPAKPITLTAETPYYILYMSDTSFSAAEIRGAVNSIYGASTIRADFALL